MEFQPGFLGFLVTVLPGVDVLRMTSESLPEDADGVFYSYPMADIDCGIPQAFRPEYSFFALLRTSPPAVARYTHVVTIRMQDNQIPPMSVEHPEYIFLVVPFLRPLGRIKVTRIHLMPPVSERLRHGIGVFAADQDFHSLGPVLSSQHASMT